MLYMYNREEKSRKRAKEMDIKLKRRHSHKNLHFDEAIAMAHNRVKWICRP